MVEQQPHRPFLLSILAERPLLLQQHPARHHRGAQRRAPRRPAQSKHEGFTPGNERGTCGELARPPGASPALVTRGEVRTDDNFAGCYELRYHQTVLRRVRYVGFDNQKKNMFTPDYEPIGKGRFYFYKADSLEYAIQRFWTTRHGRDDSKGLLIRGDGEAMRDARARWGVGVSISLS